MLTIYFYLFIRERGRERGGDKTKGSEREGGRERGSEKDKEGESEREGECEKVYVREKKRKKVIK